MLFIVPTPIGNLEDISLRAIRLFEEADVVLCEDTRVSKRLLYLLKERHVVSRTDEPQYRAMHSHNESDVIKALDAPFFEQCVLYVSDAGMPAFSDPGAKLIAHAQHLGVKYTVLPGANAALTAFVASGFDSTQMLFYGFLAHKGEARKEGLHAALYSGYIAVLYESPHRLVKLLDEIDALDAQRELFICKELSKKYEHYYRGTAASIKAGFSGSVKGEWVLIIAPRQEARLCLSYEEILAMALPKKEKSKLLSKISGESAKAIYKQLMDDKE